MGHGRWALDGGLWVVARAWAMGAGRWTRVWVVAGSVTPLPKCPFGKGVTCRDATLQINRHHLDLRSQDLRSKMIWTVHLEGHTLPVDLEGHTPSKGLFLGVCLAL